jgi:dephospho-CoA kinase
MSILNIQPVKGGQSKPIIALAGTSGSGKTLTALLMARGMVDHPREIGFLDTENKRGSLYHDALDGEFMIADLYAPFSPERYSQAIKEFQSFGVKVLVIDSVSHEWEGEMGVEDIANLPLLNGKKMANWVGGKKEHKKFMNTLLYSDMVLILCIRAREKTDFKDPMKPVSLGIQPICEKNFMFEMTASLLMENQGKNQRQIKVPFFLKEIFGNGNDYLGIETGKRIREYFMNESKVYPEIERYKSEALLICEQGTEALTKLWKSIPKELRDKKELIEHFAVCGESAKAYDKAKAEADNDGSSESIHNELVTTFELIKESIPADQFDGIKRVIDQKETSAYEKTLSYLKGL